MGFCQDERGLHRAEEASRDERLALVVDVGRTARRF